MSKWPWRRIGWGAVIAFVVFIVGGIILAGKDMPALPPTQIPMILQGGHLSNDRLTTKSWSFDYDRAQLSPDQTFGTIDGIHHGVVYRNGKPYLQIAAEHMQINTQSLDFTATGKVHVTRKTGATTTTFDTDLIVWNNAMKLLRLDHPSYVHTADETLKIDSITVDLAKDEVHMGKVDGDVSAP